MSNGSEIIWDQQMGNRKLLIELHMEGILKELGGDIDHPGMKETAHRYAMSMLEMTHGYQMDPEDVFKTFEEDTQADSMIIVAGIPFYSMCMHHMLPFHGTVDIGYVPNGRILGLSKFARLVDIFAQRFQVQERLTQQILDAIVAHLQPQGVIVVASAEHSCMSARGIKKPGSMTTTSCINGIFRDVPAARQEFLALRRSA